MLTVAAHPLAREYALKPFRWTEHALRNVRDREIDRQETDLALRLGDFVCVDADRQRRPYFSLEPRNHA